jgi:16S rRNA (guanine966-N2)-methyltransferase
MRIISGTHKGQNILTINDSKTRPMMGVAREGIFSSLQFQIADSIVLDLYAGSGSMGIEALSRGAKYITFVESSDSCVKIINKNLKKFENNYNIQNMTVDKYISNASDKFNIIFYDPPFDFEDSKISSELSRLENLLEETGIIVCHRHIKSSTIINSKNLELYKEKLYGQSRILLIKKL